ncbi:MAG: hypothetical protein IKS00_00165 [Bacteroidales bacterium]|nr:hypothetical protein [Bacteroidales bacterium]
MNSKILTLLAVGIISAFAACKDDDNTVSKNDDNTVSKNDTEEIDTTFTTKSDNYQNNNNELHEGGDKIKTNHCIESFIFCNNIKLFSDNDNNIAVVLTGTSVEEGDVRFNLLTQKYGDTSYKGYNGAPGYHRIVIADTITSVSIKCDNDFDNNHPVGSELGDIVSLHVYSLYKYIKSGYSLQFPENHDGKLYKGYMWEYTTVKASQAKKTNTELISPDFYLSFDTTPENNGKYIFTITITMTKRTITQKIAMEF